MTIWPESEKSILSVRMIPKRGFLQFSWAPMPEGAASAGLRRVQESALWMVWAAARFLTTPGLCMVAEWCRGMSRLSWLSLTTWKTVHRSLSSAILPSALSGEPLCAAAAQGTGAGLARWGWAFRESLPSEKTFVSVKWDTTSRAQGRNVFKSNRQLTTLPWTQRSIPCFLCLVGSGKKDFQSWEQLCGSANKHLWSLYLSAHPTGQSSKQAVI